MKSRKLYIFILIAIVLFGFLLRLNDLGKEGYWMDEIITIKHAQEKSPLGVIEKVGQYEGAPFGHYLLLHYWIEIFDINEISTRMLSVIFGTLSIIAMFFVGRLLFGDRIGLVSSMLLATSMLQVLYSRETRLYAMYTFLSLLATYFFI
ncbi:MAG: glycosyltransferase family 39 protein, partial [Nanoarchaeota archaeon]